MKTQNATAMLREIGEESGLMQTILRERERFTKDFVDLFRTHDFKRIYFSGCGSTGNVSLVTKYAITKLLGIEATYSFPTLFNNHEGFNVGGKYKPEEMLLICTSESGRTAPPVYTAREAKRLGIPVVCTTTNPTGILARECDVVIEKIHGKEIAAPSTKGHSTGLFTMLLCVVETARALGRISEEEYGDYLGRFEHLTKSVDDAREQTLRWFDEHQDVVMAANSFHIVGYGANYPTAVEAQLKFIESHRRPSMPFEVEEYLHGPTRAILPDTVVFLICAEDGPEKQRTLEIYRFLKAHNVHVFLVQSTRDAFQDPHGIRFDAGNDEFLATVEYVVPFQVLSYTIADCLGYDMSVSFPIYVGDENLKPCLQDGE